jgi:hypothetical protein
LLFCRPWLHKEYIESPESFSDPIRRARLLEGDWEYTTEANQLFFYDKIMDMFTNEFMMRGENAGVQNFEPLRRPEVNRTL